MVAQWAQPTMENPEEINELLLDKHRRILDHPLTSSIQPG
jgi:hypothetical protein